jgi:hypothetical protein
VQLLLAGRRPARASDAVGSVTAMEKTATLVRNSQTTPVILAIAVETNDKLIAARDSDLTVTFGDNSSLVLDASTSIVINGGVLGAANSDISKVGLLGGRLRSIVNSGWRLSALRRICCSYRLAAFSCLSFSHTRRRQEMAELSALRRKGDTQPRQHRSRHQPRRFHLVHDRARLGLGYRGGRVVDLDHRNLVPPAATRPQVKDDRCNIARLHHFHELARNGVVAWPRGPF